jgi:hypothetical protein
MGGKMSRPTGGVYDIIEERCPRCSHGYKDGDEAFCNYWMHPGFVGGNGTEWAATCSAFNDTGKVAVMKRTIVREK